MAPRKRRRARRRERSHPVAKARARVGEETEIARAETAAVEADTPLVADREIVDADALLRPRVVMGNSSSEERDKNNKVRDKNNRVKARNNRDREDVHAPVETVASSSPKRERIRGNNRPPSNQSRVKK